MFNQIRGQGIYENLRISFYVKSFKKSRKYFLVFFFPAVTQLTGKPHWNKLCIMIYNFAWWLLYSQKRRRGLILKIKLSILQTSIRIKTFSQKCLSSMQWLVFSILPVEKKTEVSLQTQRWELHHSPVRKKSNKCLCQQLKFHHLQTQIFPLQFMWSLSLSSRDLCVIRHISVDPSFSSSVFLIKSYLSTVMAEKLPSCLF